MDKFKKWAVIWKRDKHILALYGMKKTSVCVGECKETIGDEEIINPLMIFEKRSEANNFRNKNTDWEVVLVEIKIISQ